MSVIYNFLEGAYEDPAESIRQFIFQKWNNINTDGITPKMFSPLGFDDNKASIITEKQHRKNDWIQPKTADFIRFYYSRTARVQPENRVNNLIRDNVFVSIDVYAVNTNRLTLFTEEITNIIFVNMPDTTVRISKTHTPPESPQDSAIATFNTQSMEWVRIGTIEEAGNTEGRNALLGCTIEKFIN